MRFVYIILFIFIINCTGNKVSNYHGTKSLKKKYELIYINKLNKNDLKKLIGPPSTVSEFKSRCSMLTKMCGVLEKKLSKEELENLRCSEVKSLCENEFSKKAKKTKKR